MDLLLAAILLVVQTDAPAAPAQDPQASWVAWVKQLPSAHPRPLTQELAFDFELAFEELAGDEAALGDFEASMPNFNFDLRARIEILDAKRHRYSIEGSVDVSVPEDGAQAISLAGAAGLIFDGERVHAWVDGKETVNEFSARAGFTIAQSAVDEIYDHFVAKMPEILAMLPAEEFPFDREQVRDAMPPTIHDYLHPRGYVLASFKFFEAAEFEADERQVRAVLRPKPELISAMTASFQNEEEFAGHDEAKRLEFARSISEGIWMSMTLDRASGLPLDFGFNLSLPLEAFDADISGRMLFRLGARTTELQLTAPDPARLTPPADVEWTDVDEFLPLIRMQLDSLFGEPDASEQDFEF